MEKILATAGRVTDVESSRLFPEQDSRQTCWQFMQMSRTGMLRKRNHAHLARVAVLAPGYGWYLFQLLLDEGHVLERIFQAVPAAINFTI